MDETLGNYWKVERTKTGVRFLPEEVLDKKLINSNTLRLVIRNEGSQVIYIYIYFFNFKIKVTLPQVT